MSPLGRSLRLGNTEPGYAAMAEITLHRLGHFTQQSLSFYRESIYPVAVDHRMAFTDIDLRWPVWFPYSLGPLNIAQ
jgi:hypothetical protein